jgi:hypothetical protein
MRGGNRVGSRPVDIKRASESVVVRVEKTPPRQPGDAANYCTTALAK